MLRRILALCLCLCALAASAAAEDGGNVPDSFVLHHGDRSSPKIAITVDDCYQSATEWIRRDAELCKEIRWFRPPYGSVAKGSKLTEQQVIKAVKHYGFSHVIHWDVSETKDLKKALDDVQNGSILLFHAKEKDTKFLEKLIPELKDRGYEMVTVSALFGFDPPETGGELYVYHKEDYQ